MDHQEKPGVQFSPAREQIDRKWPRADVKSRKIDLLGEGNSSRMAGLTRRGPEIAMEPAKVDGGETGGRMGTCWGGEVSKRVCLAPF